MFKAAYESGGKDFVDKPMSFETYLNLVSFRFLEQSFRELLRGGKILSAFIDDILQRKSVSPYILNVVTDTLGSPSGPKDADGNATYTTDDLSRASAEEISGCDFFRPGGRGRKPGEPLLQRPDFPQTVKVENLSGMSIW